MKGLIAGIKTITHILYATTINRKMELVICWKLYTKLPKDYRFVLKEIDNALHNVAPNKTMAAIIMDTLEAFAIAASDGRHVLSVTGEDVGAFCGALLKKYETMVWTDKKSKALNDKIHNGISLAACPTTTKNFASL
jgi:DNA-binding ferritin-like protein (Dps family)